jgi:hypothetical protein
MFVFLCLCFAFTVCASPTQNSTNGQNVTDTERQIAGTGNPQNEILAEKLARLSQCTLIPLSSTLSSNIKEELDDGARLIHMHLTILNHTGSFPGEMQSYVYKPLRWTRSTGKKGRGLMMLKNTYEILSFNTLNYEVVYMDNITLTQEPPKCLSKMDINDVQEYLRRFLLNNAEGLTLNGSEEFVGNSAQEICNFHINVGDFDFGYFHYECCFMNSELEFVCERLIPTIWIAAIIVCVFAINVLVIFFCPYFVPKTFYKAHEEPVIYEHTLESSKAILVKKTIHKEQLARLSNKIKMGEILSKHMPKFEDVLQSSHMEMEKVYSFDISNLKFHVPPAKLLSSGCSPVGILSSLYHRIFLCKVGKDEKIYPCCISKMKPSNRYTWRFCLRHMMHIFLLLLAIVPWIIRVFLYYSYEDKELSDMRNAATSRGINTYYIQASFAVRYLTPIHVVFILCYLIIVFDSLVLGLVFENYLQKFKQMLTWCLHDMDAYVRYSTFEWLLRVLVWPLEKIGLYALPFIVLYWAIVLIVLSPMALYYFVPTINILIKLLQNWFAYLCPSLSCSQKLLLKSLKDEDLLPGNLPWRARLFDFFIVNMCLCTMASFLFLAVECITFFVEILVYTFVGILVNAEVTLKYVSLFFMLAVYTWDTFGSVNRIYTAYTESLINALRKIEEEQIDGIGICKKDMALKAKNMGAMDEIPPELRVDASKLKWTLHRIFMFIDKRRNDFRISTKFYFNAVLMDVDGCPGYLFPNFMKALRKLLLIILFLMFVFLVVNAFGSQYEVSGVSQMLATLVGGFLPWIFSSILFQNGVHSDSIDTDSATFSTFKRFLYAEVKKFKQSWEIADFEVTSENLTKCEGKENSDCDLIVVCKPPTHSSHTFI